MGYDLIVKNGTVVTEDKIFKSDVAIEGEKIAAIGNNLELEGASTLGPSRAPAGTRSSVKGARIIDAAGKIVIPGGIDVHVHLQLKVSGTVTSDDFETGTKAAACGGVTTIIDFTSQGKYDNLTAGVEERMREAEGKVCVDYSLHSGITGFKRLKNPAKEFKRLMDFGIPSHKMFMIYGNRGWQSDDADLFSALSLAREIGATVCVHAESEKVMDFLIAKYAKEKRKHGAYAHALSRPSFIEEEAAQRALKWSEVTGGHLYVVHLSTGKGAELFKQAHARGINAHAETCPQYLLLQDDVFKDKKRGHLYATCPQVKKKEDNERLWKGLTQGDVSIVSTDTCTFTTKQKAVWGGDFTKIPYGMPGVETLIPSIFTFGYKAGKFSLSRFVSLISTNPAKLMGLYPKKGVIAKGSDADLCVIDPKVSRFIDYKTMAANCDWSPYQGWKMFGFPDCTISRGEIIAGKGEYVGRIGRGKFVKRKGFGWKDFGK
ncbi:MAG: dihydropyrimidinase [Elusimicrobia bacterium]|nr:dihydropyrimidinase [Elusimicrobiota bacterium]